MSGTGGAALPGMVEERLEAIGFTLPPPPSALAAYVPAVVVDRWVFTAGQLPIVAGHLRNEGAVGGEVTLEEAAECSRVAVLNALAAIKAAVGGLDHIRLVRMTGYVAAAPGFDRHPQVLNGASELLVAALADRGRHARSAVGVASLPLNAPVEVELVARVEE